MIKSAENKLTLKKIRDIISKEKGVLSRKFGVTKLGIFGSYVFGDYKNDSDVDILVEYNKKLSLFDFVDAEEYLSKKIGKKVDLVSKNSLKKYIKSDILGSAIYV
ncbi:MAG: Nucleotidyltransferase [Candidatus Gottesmanbacteria bacterium GW2011_GWA1_43_11]|uniref:Nucleotidyltransferase n=1 Tax=Candidatus Gottesmanbacteria bacterium GW2011_GWA1_43_11 TaxID=1618436 RepID=A0A0G1CBQ1_9BACT|nr:MAG: Nucleotidyltransferase [Candidatus Gottesmanbacteria bacterium GW2011_GWA1_43_11]